jgi:hypothetical protein
MEDLVDESGGVERDFLGQLLGEFVPERIRGLVRSPSVERASQLVMLLALTGTVGLGYLYGETRSRLELEDSPVDGAQHGE